MDKQEIQTHILWLETRARLSAEMNGGDTLEPEATMAKDFTALLSRVSDLETEAQATVDEADKWQNYKSGAAMKRLKALLPHPHKESNDG